MLWNWKTIFYLQTCSFCLGYQTTTFLCSAKTSLLLPNYYWSLLILYQLIAAFVMSPFHWGQQCSSSLSVGYWLSLKNCGGGIRIWCRCHITLILGKKVIIWAIDFWEGKKGENVLVRQHEGCKNHYRPIGHALESNSRPFSLVDIENRPCTKNNCKWLGGGPASSSF